MRLAAIAIVGLSVLGCADTHQVLRTGGARKSTDVGPRTSAYVALPSDGRYGATVYTGSGATTAQIIGSAFAPYLGRTTTGAVVEDIEQVHRSAVAGRFDYLLYLQILQWEDRATEWSGRPDRVSVKVSLIGIEVGELLDSAVIEGKSGLATFGGDHPQDLLPQPMADYAASLFR